MSQIVGDLGTLDRALCFALCAATFACSSATEPPDPPEFFVTTDSVSYTLMDSGEQGFFLLNLVTQFTHPLPDTLYFLSCGDGPFWTFERLTEGVFSPSEIPLGCGFLGEKQFLPGEVTTDTLRWIIPSAGSIHNEEVFRREIPGTFRVVFVVWDSLGENHVNREIDKKLRVSAPFDILPALGGGG